MTGPAGDPSQHNQPDWREVAGQLAEAIRLTREYVGEETLPAIPGWSWFDAIAAYHAAVATGDHS